MSRRHPARLIERHVDDLRLLFPRLRDGGVEDVHRARVATRRLRETLPLIAAAHPVDDAAKTLKDVARALGAVRELDVMRETLIAAEEWVPAGAAAAAAARRSLVERHEDAQRQLIKTIERTRAQRALRKSLPAPSAFVRVLHLIGSSRRWQQALRKRIHTRADNMAAALQHASGVYFPNRLHRLRIAVKKLRYSVEAADTLGLWRPRHLVRDLKRIQARLGEIHDWQVLLDRMDDLVADETLSAARRALTDGVRALVRSRYSEFLERRDRLEQATAACRRFARSSPTMLGVSGGSLTAASVVLVPVALAVTTARARRKARPVGAPENLIVACPERA
jgi:CHAD domain-containing protein